MTLLPHQEIASSKLQKKLAKHGVALLWGEPRSGKTLSFIDAAHKVAKKSLIITTKKAMTDITSAVASYGAYEIDIINYHSCQKMNPDDYDLIIFDECHKYIGGYPKRSSIWTNAREFTKDKKVIYSSGTPTPEGYSNLFNMLALSDKSPWRRFERFTSWHAEYGLPYQIRIGMNSFTKYDRCFEDKVKKDIKKFVVGITRKEGGHKFEATDKIHDIEPSKRMRKMLDQLQRDLVVEKGKYVILGDTPAKLSQKRQQIVGGTCKCEDDELMIFKKNPKIDYIKEHFDPEDTIILSFFRAEQELLAATFPHTGSVVRDAEGVDFSHFKNLVVYSMSYAAQSYEQVRARQLNMIKRKTEVVVHYLLSDIDHHIYEAVSKKKNFTAKWYRK